MKSWKLVLQLDWCSLICEKEFQFIHNVETSKKTAVTYLFKKTLPADDQPQSGTKMATGKIVTKFQTCINKRLAYKSRNDSSAQSLKSYSFTELHKGIWMA